MKNMKQKTFQLHQGFGETGYTEIFVADGNFLINKPSYQFHKTNQVGNYEFTTDSGKFILEEGELPQLGVFEILSATEILYTTSNFEMGGSIVITYMPK